MAPMLKMPNATNHMRPTVVGAFILPSLVGTFEHLPTRRRTCDNARKAPTKPDFNHCG
jgi:hypothetical protein